MSQSDQDVSNATFPSVRAQINDNIKALFSQSSGNSEPTVKVAYQPWINTSASPPTWNIWTGSAWLTVGVLDPAGFNAGGVTQIANGGTGATTATAALAALLPNQGGNAGKALVTSGSAASWGTVSGITNGTAVASTSGTAIDFTGIPSSVKRVTVMFDGVSTNGTSNWLLQIGDSGGVEDTGYTSQANTFNGAPNGTVSSVGFLLLNVVGATSTYSGFFSVCNVSGNAWVTSGVVVGNTTAGGVSIFGGTKTLSGTLDRVRITTVGGANTFDAGSINISWQS